MSDSANPFAAMLPVAQAKLDQIVAIDDKLVKFHGTMAQWQTKAATEVDGTTMADTLKFWGLTPDTWATEFFGPVYSIVKSDSSTVADFVNAVNLLADNTKQYRSDRMDAVIKAGMGATDTAGLLDQRAALVKEVEAFKLVLLDQKIDGADTLVIPAEPKAGRKGGGQPKGASKYIRFYRINNATDQNPVPDQPDYFYPADIQQKASSIAWYQFYAGIEAMEAAMRTQGWDGSYTKPWVGRITLTSKDGTATRTKTIGWDIVADDSTEADQTTEAADQDGDDS